MSSTPDKSTPASRFVSYLIPTAGGGVLGFFMALCSIGGTARYPRSILASDLTHGIWIVGLTALGAGLGLYSAWRILRQRSRPDGGGDRSE